MNFLLYLPYRKCFLNADLTYPAVAATGVREIDKWHQREANECTRSATHNPQAVLVGGCLSARLAREISVGLRSRRIYRTLSLDANQHYYFCVVNLLCKILCIIRMPRRLSVTRYRYNATQVLYEILRNELSDGDMFMYKDTKIFHIVGSSDGL